MLAIILASYTMIVLDISIVITALPKIHHALGFSSTALSWVQNAYLLAFGGLLLLGARAGDMLGRRRMFVAGCPRASPTTTARRGRRPPACASARAAGPSVRPDCSPVGSDDDGSQGEG